MIYDIWFITRFNSDHKFVIEIIHGSIYLWNRKLILLQRINNAVTFNILWELGNPSDIKSDDILLENLLFIAWGDDESKSIIYSSLITCNKT